MEDMSEKIRTYVNPTLHCKPYIALKWLRKTMQTKKKMVQKLFDKKNNQSKEELKKKNRSPPLPFPEF